MSKRKVTFAKLHQTAYAPGVGELRATFPSPDKSLDGLAMWVDEVGNLEVNFAFRGIKKTLLFTAANVQVMDLAPEPAQVPKVEVVKETKKNT